MSERKRNNKIGFSNGKNKQPQRKPTMFWKNKIVRDDLAELQTNLAKIDPDKRPKSKKKIHKKKPQIGPQKQAPTDEPKGKKRPLENSDKQIKKKRKVET